MGFFDVLAAGFLAAAFVRQKVVATEAFQKAMTIFFAAAILYFVGGAIPFVNMVAAPIGLGLSLWSFRELCLAVAGRDAANRHREAEEF